MKDRVDLSSLSDVPPGSQPSMSEVISKVFPSAHEESVMHDFAVLLARMLCTHMSYFKETFADVIDWHISHRYSAEMSTKSDVVSCNYYNYGVRIVCFSLHQIMRVGTLGSYDEK